MLTAQAIHSTARIDEQLADELRDKARVVETKARAIHARVDRIKSYVQESLSGARRMLPVVMANRVATLLDSLNRQEATLRDRARNLRRAANKEDAEARILESLATRAEHGDDQAISHAEELLKP